MPLDFGHGRVSCYMGGPVREECPIVELIDGTLLPIKEGHLRALAMSLVHGNKEAGVRLGLTEVAVKQLCSRLYARLGVFSRWEAAHVLGWTAIPETLLDAPGIDGAGPADGQG